MQKERNNNKIRIKLSAQTHSLITEMLMNINHTVCVCVSVCVCVCVRLSISRSSPNVQGMLSSLETQRPKEPQEIHLKITVIELQG